MAHKARTDELQHHVDKILREFDTAMLVTQTREGDLRARPMAVAEREGLNKLWFITAHDTGKVDEINFEHSVLVTFQRDRDYYLSCQGYGEVVHDRDKIREVWRTGFKVWFPDGKDDPNLVLIRVELTGAEYWDNSGLRQVKYAGESLKALATHSTPDVEGSDMHGTVRL